MFALAVLDLPFEAGKHDVEVRRRQDDPHPGRPADRLPRGGPPGRRARAASVPILVSQNFYRHGDRYRDENGEKLDKFVTGEFVVHTVYGCQVVVTNPTSSRQKLSVLVQLPVGAIPVGERPVHPEPCRSTWSRTARRRSTTCSTSRRPGKFAHFPVHVAKNEQFVAAAAAGHVRRGGEADASPTPTSWDYVSQNGTADEVLAFLEPRERAGPEPRQDRLPDEGPRRSSRRSLELLHGPARVPARPSGRYALLHADAADRPAVPAARRPARRPSAAGRSTARC